MARPCVLDDAKQREICALVTAGMSITKIAAYVGCDRRTIQRLRKTDDDFDLRMRQATMAEELGPLQTLRNASKTHWRAAAYVLERQERREADQRSALQRHKVAADLQAIAHAVKGAIAGQVPDRVTVAMLEAQIDEIFANPALTTTEVEPATHRQQAASMPQTPPGYPSRSKLDAAYQALADRVAMDVAERNDDDDDDYDFDDVDFEDDDFEDDHVEHDIDDGDFEDGGDPAADDSTPPRPIVRPLPEGHGQDGEALYSVDLNMLAEKMAELHQEALEMNQRRFAALAAKRAQQPADWPVEDVRVTPTKRASNEHREAT